VEIPFGEWLPDVHPINNPGSTTAKNVIPLVEGYAPLKSLAVGTDAIDAYCRGMFADKASDGNTYQYAGTADKLYGLVGSTWTDYSISGGYALTSGEYWEFAKFNNKVIAVSIDSNPQSLAFGGTTFANLSTAFKARHINANPDFVIVGNTYDTTDGNMPNRVRWCAYQNETDWTVSASTQADYQDLEGSGGWVQGIVGSENIYVFQERAVWRMTYVGSPVVFQFDRIEENRGAWADRSIISSGGVTYYLADDGFYAISGGVSYPIGAGKVDKTFLADLNSTYLNRISSASFPQEKVIIWSYPSTSSTDGTPDKVIMYNWASKKWSFGAFNHEMIYRAQSVGITLDGLDAAGYTNIDTMTISLDSKSFMGGTLTMSAFDTNHKLSYFTGTALDAVLETGEFGGKDRREITEVIPIVDGGTHTVQMGTRETQAGTVSWGSVSTENSSGVCPVRSNSRYHRARVNITGDFNYAVGIEVPDESIINVGRR